MEGLLPRVAGVSLAVITMFAVACSDDLSEPVRVIEDAGAAGDLEGDTGDGSVDSAVGGGGGTNQDTGRSGRDAADSDGADGQTRDGGDYGDVEEYDCECADSDAVCVRHTIDVDNPACSTCPDVPGERMRCVAEETLGEECRARECPDGFSCDPETGDCVCSEGLRGEEVCTPTCESDADCPSSFECNDEAHCEPPTPCAHDSQCEVDEYCVDERCVSKEAIEDFGPREVGEDCEHDRQCKTANCEREAGCRERCLSDRDCSGPHDRCLYSGGAFCVDEAHPDYDCEVSCPEDSVCEGDECIRPCRFTADCETGDCISRRCAPDLESFCQGKELRIDEEDPYCRIRIACEYADDGSIEPGCPDEYDVCVGNRFNANRRCGRLVNDEWDWPPK